MLREASNDKLGSMRNVQLVIPELFLPLSIAATACADLNLPELEKLLARSQHTSLADESLETWLCRTFGIPDCGIAPVTLRADGLEPGAFYWLRADPVHLRLDRDRLLLQSEATLTGDEAAQLCAGLNAHFADDNLHFIAAHPQRWYLRLNVAPNISTLPPAQVEGRNIHEHLPRGPDALRWHSVFNEIQMLLFEHPVNRLREIRGELPVNSVWLWGGGQAGGALLQPYARVLGDSDLASAIARVAGTPCAPIRDVVPQCETADAGDILVVFEGLRKALQRGDLYNWREELQRFEMSCFRPLVYALQKKRIARLILDIPQAGISRRFELTRAGIWKLWVRPKPLERYAV